MAVKHPEPTLLDVAQHLNDAFWVTWRDSERAVYVSPTFPAVLGVPLAEQYADPTAWARRLHPDDRSRAAALLDGDGAFRLVQGDGTERRARIRRIRLAECATTDGLVLTVVSDISCAGEGDRRLCDAASLRREAEKMDALGRLARNVAHEFGNALNVIALQAESIRRTSLSPAAASALAGIEAMVRRTSHITSSLSGLAGGGGTRVQVNVCETVSRVIRFANSMCRGGVEMRLSAGADEAFVIADPSLFEQVLLNVVTNAVEAIDGVGEVEVDVRVEREPSSMAARLASPVITVSVSDTGCGMSPSIRERIFEPFYTTKDRREHRGLGLATVYSVVHDAGGTIGVDTELGRGTRFEVRWPSFAAPGTLPHPA